MVRTWERSYFRTEGLRALYVLPRKATDAILPISIEPAPRSLVRVLVGRLECVTPEDEETVAWALANRRSEAPETRRKAEEKLARYGRFLEPHVRRALELAKDDAVRRGAREVLAEIEAGGR